MVLATPNYYINEADWIRLNMRNKSNYYLYNDYIEPRDFTKINFVCILVAST